MHALFDQCARRLQQRILRRDPDERPRVRVQHIYTIDTDTDTDTLQILAYSITALDTTSDYIVSTLCTMLILWLMHNSLQGEAPSPLPSPLPTAHFRPFQEIGHYGTLMPNFSLCTQTGCNNDRITAIIYPPGVSNLSGESASI